MQININANSLKKLVRLMRLLANELESLYAQKKSESPTPMVVISKNDSNTHLVVDYYKITHPNRGKGLNNKHKDWRLIRKRLDQGYSVKDLKRAIDGNFNMKFWKEKRLHGIQHIFGKDGNLETFISFGKNKDYEKDGKTGYNSGSTEWGSDFDGFGDGD